MDDQQTQGGIAEKWEWDHLVPFIDRDCETWKADEAMAILAGLMPGTETEKLPGRRIPLKGDGGRYFAHKAMEAEASAKPENMMLAERRADFKKYKDRWLRKTPKEAMGADQYIDRDIFVRWAIKERINIPWLIEAESRGIYSLKRPLEKPVKYFTKKEKIIVVELLKIAGIEFDKEGIPARKSQKKMVDFMDSRGKSLDRGTVRTFFNKCGWMADDD